MLKLVKTKPKKELDYALIYSKLFDKALNNYVDDEENKKYMKQLAFYGVKTVNEVMKKRESTEYEYLLKFFEFVEIVKTAISLLTPNELLTVFPIDKTFDGDKYETKDYFYTMNELKKIGMNNVVGSNIDYLLWDYMNSDINRFLVNSMSIMDDIYKMETGCGILEKWADENNISMYKVCKNETTNQEFLFEPKTGKSFSIKKQSPKYLQPVK